VRVKLTHKCTATILTGDKFTTEQRALEG